LRSRRLIPALTLFVCALRPSAAAELSRGEVLQVRLTTRVCSQASKAGDRVTAVILGRTRGDAGDEVAGAELSGTVTESRAVGFGVKHTRARLRLQFDTLRLPGSDAVSISTRLLGVDNARESVDAAGAIHGIDAGAGPTNQISSRMVRMPSLNPYPDLALLAYKLASPIFADPEIHYPAGTELSILVAAPLALPAGGPGKVKIFSEPEARLEELVQDLPVRTQSGNGERAADVVNLVFVGPRSQLVQAFRSSGWSTSDRRNAASLARGLRAVFEQRNYDTAPMSRQTIGGRAPDLTWQKGLNDQAKRHHIRVWDSTEDFGDQEVWAASATRDIAAGFNPRSFKLYHRIEQNIDLERGKIVRDLIQTGCVDSVHWVDRPWVPRRMLNTADEEMITDGAVAVLFMGPCRSDAATAPAVVPDRDVHHGPIAKRWLRKEILSLRYDFLRANIIGTSFEAARLVWRRWRPYESPETLAVNSLLDPARQIR
jgi:hypothetical protein